MDGVVVSSGTLTLGDVYILNGATVAVSGGGLSVEKVTGAGAESVIDLGGTHVEISAGKSGYASGCTFSGGSAYTGGAVRINYASATFADCRFVNNTTPSTAGAAGGAINIVGSALINNCVFNGNTANTGAVIVLSSGHADIRSCTMMSNGSSNNYGILAVTGGTATVADTVISSNTYIAEMGDIFVASGAHVYLDGGNTIKKCVAAASGQVYIGGSNAIELITSRGAGNGGSVIISSGASINLTSSINPGGNGGIVVDGGCVVNGNAIPAGTYTSIDSNGQPT